MTTTTQPSLHEDLWLEILAFHHPVHTPLWSKSFRNISHKSCDLTIDKIKQSPQLRYYFTIWNGWKNPFAGTQKLRVSNLHGFLRSVFITALPLSNHPSLAKVHSMLHRIYPTPKRKDFISTWDRLLTAIQSIKNTPPNFPFFPPLLTSEGRNFNSVPEDECEEVFWQHLQRHPDMEYAHKIEALFFSGHDHEVIPSLDFLIPTIQVISIIGCKALKANPLRHLGYNHLRILDISGYIPDKYEMYSSRGIDQEVYTVNRPDRFQTVFANLSFLSNLPALQTLLLNNNCFTHLPRNLERLAPKLQVLGVRNCYWLRELPPLHRLDLRKLYVNGCHSLTKIPVELKPVMESGRLSLSNAYRLRERPFSTVTLIEKFSNKPSTRATVLLDRSTCPAVDGYSRVNYSDGSKGKIREATSYNTAILYTQAVQRILMTLNFE